MTRWGAVLFVYATLGVSAGWGAYALRGAIWIHPSPWLELEPWTAHLYSGVIGLTLGLCAVATTGPIMRHFRWARTLHQELMPLVRGLSPALITALALLSSIGEELLFRSLLQPEITLWGQAALFGLAHQLPGRARWIWVTWATIMGLALGVLFQSTGSLVGPILAHATINGLNLRFLQQPTNDPSRRPMGGVLGQRT